MSGFKVGDRVRLTRHFERYPHCMLSPGTAGTVALVDAEAIVLAVRWDEHVDGLEEWDNEGHWSRDDVADGDDPKASLALISTQARVQPCPCKYWEHNWTEADVEAGAGPMAVYDAKTGLLDCIECCAPLEVQP